MRGGQRKQELSPGCVPALRWEEEEKEEVSGSSGVGPLYCSLRVISAHRGAWSWERGEGLMQGLYEAVQRHPHLSALLGDPRALIRTSPPPPVSAPTTRQCRAN